MTYNFLKKNITNYVFLIALCITLLIELILVERKYSIFKGGFLSSHSLDTTIEVSLFFLSLLLTQIIAVSVILVVFLRLSKKHIFVKYYNFIFFIIALVSIVLGIKYKLLSYFSDAVSFQLIKNLGGGSILDSLLYVMEEGIIFSIIFILCLFFYWIGYRLISSIGYESRERLDNNNSVPEILITKKIPFFIIMSFLFIIIYFSNTLNDTKYSLNHFLSYKLFNTAFVKMTDFDGDGYSYFTSPMDKFPFDAARYPYALDVPNNGIDEDGFLGDFQFENQLNPAVLKRSKNPKNLIVIVLESTRGDLIGKKINGITVAPNITSMSEDGSIIKEAYSHVGYTAPSIKALFSGSLYPTEKSSSIFRDLKKNGYKVAVFSGQSESFGNISKTLGMEKSSDIFIDAEVLKNERAFSYGSAGSLLIDGKILLREFENSLGDKSKWSKPTFIYINFQSPHFPYYHPGMTKTKILSKGPIPRSEISKKTEEHLKETYWNAVSYADWLVGQIIKKLKLIGVYKDTIVLVTADHGESLFDDNFLGHGHFINRQQTHIPLVVNVPDIKISKPIGLSDYYALIMQLLGLSNDQNSFIDEKDHYVFQYIGNIHKPSSIGIVEKKGRFTVMNLETQDVYFSDLNKKVVYKKIKSSPLKERVNKLINEWEKHRWLYHLSKLKTSP